MSQPRYIVVTPAGEAVFDSASPDEALAYARQLGPTQWLVPATEARALRAANPGAGRLLPMVGRRDLVAQARKNLGPRLDRVITREEVYSLRPEDVGLPPDAIKLRPKDVANAAKVSLETAKAAVYPYFLMADRAAREAGRRAVQEEGAPLTQRARDTIEAAIKAGVPPDVATREAVDDLRNYQGVALSPANWMAPAKGWLGVNAKLAKTIKGKQAMALGLSLLPEYSAFRGRSEAGVEFEGFDLNKSAGGKTLCTFASKDCRSACLVNTGQNAAGHRSNYTKLAKARALIEQPVAFLRILCEALDNYAAYVPKGFEGGELIRYVRLNVFSDVPWEEVVPWLFKEYTAKGLTFYDYTKVPGRLSPGHPVRKYYDLSFSRSGENDDMLAAEFEQNRRRVVYVYVAAQYVRSQQVTQSVVRKFGLNKKALEALDKQDAEDDGAPLDPKLKQAEKALAATWRQVNAIPLTDIVPGVGRRRVVDGDESDFRPLDPDNVIVGLRWKAPKQYDKDTKKREEVPYGKIPQAFVIRGTVIDETSDGRPIFRVAAETPSNSSETWGPAKLRSQAIEAAFKPETRKKWFKALRGGRA